MMPTQDDLFRLFDIDFATGIMRWRHRSGRAGRYKAGEIAGHAFTERKAGLEWQYHTISVNGRNYRRARLIYLAYHGVWPMPTVDHIDHNTLNDAIANLRPATQAEQNFHRRRRARLTASSGGTALPRGVHESWPGRFGARVQKHGKSYYLGPFDSVQAADEACRRKREELFGEFAVHTPRRIFKAPQNG